MRTTCIRCGGSMSVSQRSQGDTLCNACLHYKTYSNQKIYDRAYGTPLQRLHHSDPDRWITAEGVEMLVARMTPQHCLNCVALLERRYLTGDGEFDPDPLEQREFDDAPLIQSLRRRIDTATDLDWIDGKWKELLWLRAHGVERPLTPLPEWVGRRATPPPGDKTPGSGASAPATSGRGGC